MSADRAFLMVLRWAVRSRVKVDGREATDRPGQGKGRSGQQPASHQLDTGEAAGGEGHGPLQRSTGGRLGEVARRPSHSDLGVTSSVGPFATRGVFTECRRLGQRNMVFVPFPVEALAFGGGPGGSRAPPELLGGACAGTEKQNERSLQAWRESQGVLCRVNPRRFPAKEERVAESV